jgi:cell fate regulator YaaT (PSP1 superfamily)
MIKYFLTSLLLITFSQQAAAYLDPGTGSMILQGIIASIAVAGFTIKNYWYRIRAFFGKEAPSSLLDDDEDEMYVKIVKTRFSLDRRRLFFRYIAKAPLNLTRFIDPIQSMLNCGVNLWQVGVRDECRLIGCIGSCGRQSCCSSWQKHDCPVNLKMAKNQGIALNPSSLNGTCNRLKCCLQYENHIYEEAGAGIPAIGVKVSCPGYENVKGTIIKRDVLRGRVVVRDSEGKFMTVSVEEVEIIK